MLTMMTDADWITVLRVFEAVRSRRGDKGVTYAIFENSILAKDIGVEPSLASLRTNAIAVGNALGRRSLSLLDRLPWTKDFAGALHAVSFLSVTDALVCMDDFGRRYRWSVSGVNYDEAFRNAVRGAARALSGNWITAGTP
jgi:hypothetical protein